MPAPNQSELPTTQTGIDAFLADAASEAFDREMRSDLPDARELRDQIPYPDEDEELDPEREITLYGAMLVALTEAVDALRGQKMTADANAFRSFLIDFRNRLRR